MHGLPSQLLEQCQFTLEQCSQFHSAESLKSVFVTSELVRYRHDLPEGKNESERVHLTIDFLISKRLVNGQAVFTLFLKQLRKHHKVGDKLHNQLLDLESKIIQALNQSEISIPFVVISMTQAQAENLIAGNVLSEWSTEREKHAFSKLRNTLGNESTTKLLTHYGNSPEDWKPTVESDDTIQSIIEDAIEDININPFRYYPPITPYFFSTDFLSDTDDMRLATWDELGWRGCILVVDAISLFHPMLYRRLLQSELGANERVAIAVTTTSPHLLNHRQSINFIQNEFKSRMQRAFVRAKWYDEQLCRHNIENLDTLRHWIKYNAIPETARVVSTQKDRGRPRAKNKQKIQSSIDAPGIGPAIFGHGVNV